MSASLRFPRVLVTGATGLLGRPLTARLVETGYQVTALGGRCATSPFAPTVAYAHGDWTNAPTAAALLRPWRWDAVVHLAGPVPTTAAGYQDADGVAAHVALAHQLTAAVPDGWPGRLIHASSMTVYGVPQRLPVDETHPRAPINAYGRAKLQAEDVLLAWADRTGADAWLLRLPGLFGEARWSGAIVGFMRAAASGRPIVVDAPTPLPWDVLHVTDAVEAISRALQASATRPGPVNISYGEPVELTAMAERIAAYGRVSVVRSNKVQHPVFQMDIRQARQLLSWPPTTLGARLDALWQVISAGQCCDAVTS